MTTPHERDRSLETWLSASLPRTGAATDACLDGETVAAWLDGGLDSASRQQADAHVSSCARCQALVASVVALETAEAEAVEPAPSGWRTWLNWMVPLGAMATAALALAVWLNVPAPPLRQAAAPGQSRIEPAAPTAAEGPSPSSAGAAQPPVEAGPERRATAAATARKAAGPPAPELGRAEGTTTPPPAADASARPAARGRTAAPGAAANVAAPPSPAPAPAPAAPGATVAAPRALDAAAPATAQQDAVVSQAFAARETSGVDVGSPDPQVRWRLAGRALTRSTDGGATWISVVADAGASLRAGAAPSTAICWMVGDAGLVLRSFDGVTFVRVAAPAAVPLVSVSATSAANALVTTADGRRFVTADGGTTWAPAR